MGYFIGGLRPEIRMRVRTFNPANRLQAMRLARDVETELQGASIPRGGGSTGTRAWKGSRDWSSGYVDKGGSGSGQYPNTSKLGSGLGPSVGTQSKGNLVGNSIQSESRTTVQQGSRTNGDEGRRSVTGDRNRGTKHLPYSELMNRKAQGLCFRCGERYHPLHQCAEKQLRLLVLGDDETVNEIGEIIAIEVQEEEEEQTLDCGSMGVFGLMDTDQSGGIPPSTLRVEGKINGVSLVMLIDTGASHNFVSPQVVAALEIAVEQGKTMGVRLGDGHKVATGGKCKGVEVQLGEFKTSVESYVLELGDLDMILGVAWLRKFGKVTFDWEEMTLSFCWEGQKVEL